MDQPRPGHPIQRSGKPYVWVTWLAQFLGGKQCRYALWFKARFKYTKFETHGADLTQWNADHNAMMRDRQVELEEAGYTVLREDACEYKHEGETAIVAGKPDLIALMDGTARQKPVMLVVDGKTGKERESDVWQVILYLFSLVRCRKDLTEGRTIAGEVHYKVGDRRRPVQLSELTEARRQDVLKAIAIVTQSDPPPKSPSRYECEKCNIGPQDCPDRYQPKSHAIVHTGDF
jgi:CRISPR/Cas system-associated exonuclease Cas4 (RecB family)